MRKYYCLARRLQLTCRAIVIAYSTGCKIFVKPRNLTKTLFLFGIVIIKLVGKLGKMPANLNKKECPLRAKLSRQEVEPFADKSLAGKKWCPLRAKPSRQEVELFADKSLAGKKWCPLRAKLSRQEVVSFEGKNQPKKVESFVGKAQPARSGVLCGQKLSRQEVESFAGKSLVGRKNVVFGKQPMPNGIRIILQ